MSGRKIVILRTNKEIKRIGEHEGVEQGYRWQSVELREISAFPLTKLIMDVPLFSSEAESSELLILEA